MREEEVFMLIPYINKIIIAQESLWEIIINVPNELNQMSQEGFLDQFRVRRAGKKCAIPKK